MDQFQKFKIKSLVESGYSNDVAVNALNIWDWDLSQAKIFLRSQEPLLKQDEDLRKVIEISKNEAGVNMYQQNHESSFLRDLEPLSLENRLRSDNTPVGLKNIGNTCYINSFIQALFHLPWVMEKVMSLKDSTELQRQSSLNAMKRIECSYNMIVQMKRLFAFMTKSEKKYADPSIMIRNIVDDFGNQMKIGDQQDISEVSEGFMTRIHEGFMAILEPFSSENEQSPFEEELKESESNQEQENESVDSDKQSLIEKVENFSKNNKSEGFIKDMFYGKQIETTEWIEEKDSETIEEGEFLMILLNIEVRFYINHSFSKATTFTKLGIKLFDMKQKLASGL